eukprot:TRINITY_DN31942_c0_g1_i1.p1 TRINITY_DN31942_c0_g1~~TRINITY_DN31942_c0_g1_i1.p1  ORF type:complete len:330 (+),score=35.65 TRINITY_DN31942_c0_g1_i1:85-1074(+)
MDAMCRQPLNAVIGDAGFISQFGYEPSPEDAEDTRIKAHLLYVAQLLAERDAESCSLCIRRRRRECIALLEGYAKSGQFPKHEIKPCRRTPIFMDHLGTPCAVAHLMCETGDPRLCGAVDAHYHHGFISEMLVDDFGVQSALANDIVVWSESVGLTVKELEMIQPGYTELDQKKLGTIIMCIFAGGCASGVAGLCGILIVALSYHKQVRPGPVEWILAGLSLVQCSWALVALLQRYLRRSNSFVDYWGVAVAWSLPINLVLLACIPYIETSGQEKDIADKICFVFAYIIVPLTCLVHAVSQAIFWCCVKIQVPELHIACPAPSGLELAE